MILDEKDIKLEDVKMVDVGGMQVENNQEVIMVVLLLISFV